MSCIEKDGGRRVGEGGGGAEEGRRRGGGGGGGRKIESKVVKVPKS